MTAKISTLLDSTRISLCLPAVDGVEAIGQTAKLLQGHPAVLNFRGLMADLYARAEMETICLGNAIALPHARTVHVSDIVIAVGRSDNDLAFASSSEVARLFFLIATPVSRPDDYLRLVGALCRLLKQPGDRADLLSAPDPGQFLTAVVRIEDRALVPA